MNHKKITLLNIVGLLFAAQFAHGQSLLWKISKDGTKVESFLYGTIHIKDKRVFAFPDTLLHALESADAVVLELELGNKTSKELSKLLLLPEGEQLSDYYSEIQMEHIRAVLEEKADIPLSVFMHMKPVALLTTLSESYFKSDMPYALDEYFQQYATKERKPVIGLETVTEQLSALMAISPQQIYEYVTDTAKNDSMVEPMIAAYLQADFSLLSELMNQDSMMVTYSDELITTRNVRMAERIAVQVADKSCFIAIGAGHLRGDKGVVDLLIANGFDVEPVFYAWPQVPELAEEIRWSVYDNGRYSVELPENYTIRQHELPSENGTAKVPTIEATNADGTFWIMELLELGHKIGAKEFVKKAKEAAQVAGGTFISADTSLSSDSLNVVITTIQLREYGYIFQKHICSDEEYLLLQVIQSEGSEPSKSVMKFFDSVKLY